MKVQFEYDPEEKKISLTITPETEEELPLLADMVGRIAREVILHPPPKLSNALPIEEVASQLRILFDSWGAKEVPPITRSPK